MKRLIVAVFLTAAVVSIMLDSMAFAGTAQNNTGCGLGTMLFKDNANDSALLQAIQAFLNFFPPLSLVPTVGITAGSAECQKPKKFASSDQVNEFMAANMDNLARDIAQGRGETLDAFAELLRIPAEERPEFYLQLQSGFGRIYTSPDVQTSSVMDNIAAVSPAVLERAGWLVEPLAPEAIQAQNTTLQFVH
jgi:Protein of unknown function (DUF3015)